MGFSFLTEALLQAALPQDGVAARHRKFWLYHRLYFWWCWRANNCLQESTLTAVLPVVTRREFKTLLAAGRLWAIVLTTNLIGTWIFALLIHHAALFPDDVNAALGDLATKPFRRISCDPAPRVFAGWLIALMVWILPSAQSSRLLTVFLVTYVVALGRLSMSVAGSSEAAYSVLSGVDTIGHYFTLFLLPTLLGNIIGGTLMVTVLNHGAIAPEIHKDNPQGSS